MTTEPAGLVSLYRGMIHNTEFCDSLTEFEQLVLGLSRDAISGAVKKREIYLALHDLDMMRERVHGIIYDSNGSELVPITL